MEQRPEPFQRVDVNLAEAIAIVIPGEFARPMADRLVTVTPLDQAAIDVVFIGVDQSPLRYHPVDQGLDGHLLDVLQHPDHDLASALHHPEDRRLLLGQSAPASLAFQASPPGEASFFLTASGWP